MAKLTEREQARRDLERAIERCVELGLDLLPNNGGVAVRKFLAEGQGRVFVQAALEPFTAIFDVIAGGRAVRLMVILGEHEVPVQAETN
jgi:hypothetical protein